MNHRTQAEDLFDRLQKYKDVLEEYELVDMIEELLIMTVQDYINAENFKDVSPGDTEAEVKVLLQKGMDHVKESDAYIEAAFMTVCELERKTKEDRFIAGKLSLIDAGKTARNTYDKIAFIKKQLDLE